MDLKQVTIKTVAERAGVSPTTVSRVLNGKVDAIPETTQHRVLEAAREVDYRPNQLAVNLRMRRASRTVGLMVGDISDGYFHLLARGVEDAAQAHGYQIILCNSDRSPTKELHYVELLEEKRVEAIIFGGGGVGHDRHLQNHHWRDTVVVLVGPHELDFPTVEVDNRAAIETAVRHLAAQGCRRVAGLGRHPGWLVAEDRLAGYQAGLAGTGLDPDPDLEWDGDFTFESGINAVRRALERKVDFDGVVAFNDYAALGVIQALNRAGRQVPEEVAVIGCDDLSIAAMLTPPLSSVALPVYELGAAAMRLALGVAGGEIAAARLDFPTTLHARQSSLRLGQTVA